MGVGGPMANYIALGRRCARSPTGRVRAGCSARHRLHRRAAARDPQNGRRAAPDQPGRQSARAERHPARQAGADQQPLPDSGGHGGRAKLHRPRPPAGDIRVHADGQDQRYPALAGELVALLRPLRSPTGGAMCHVNLIPLNPVSESPYQPSTPECGCVPEVARAKRHPGDVADAPRDRHRRGLRTVAATDGQRWSADHVGRTLVDRRWYNTYQTFKIALLFRLRGGLHI